MYRRTELFIDGNWVDTHDGRPSSRSPRRIPKKSIGQAPAAAPADVDRAVAAARAAFDAGPWPRLLPSRAHRRRRAPRGRYKERRKDMAELISAEIGAPITFAKRVQAQLPMMAMAAFTKVASEYPWQEARPGFYGNDIRVSKLPVGVVAAVVPWNMPQFLTIGKVVPALLAGCTVVLKPAPKSPLSTRYCSPKSSRQPSCHRGCSTWCRATGPPARTWSPIRASTRCRSPVPPQQGDRWRSRAPTGCGRSARTGRQVRSHCARRRRSRRDGESHSNGEPGQQRAGLQCAEPRAGARLGRNRFH